MAYFLLNNSRNNLTTSLNRETNTFTSLATQPIGDYYTIYNQSGTLLIKQQMQKMAALDPSVTNIAVVNLQGLSQFSMTGKPINVSTGDLSSFKATAQTDSRGQIIQAVQPYVDSSGRHSFAVAYQISPGLVNETIQRGEETILALVLISLLLCMVAMYIFTDLLFVGPLNQLAESSEALVQGNFNITKLDGRSDEIGKLATSINNMANSLKLNITKLKDSDIQKDEFMKIVSHNLRTPLTIIQSNAAFLESSQLTPILKKMVKGIEDSARRLNLFSEQILTITDYETGKAGSGFMSETSLNEMLGGLSREYEELAKAKNVVFKTNIQNGEVKFLSSQFLIAQAVRNLLDNALKFTPEQGTVELSASIGQKVLILVKDTGIGIKPEEIPRLFTKFHRGSDTLVYNYEGTGIGLYVTKLIIEEQKGTIRAESKLGEGTAFIIELPYSPPAVVQTEEQLSSR
jgi:two-component system OmpR family sensor kinase